MLRSIVFILTLAFSLAPASGRPLKAVVFDLELLDTSYESERGERPDQTRRLDIASAELRRLLSESGQLRLVDLSLQASRIRKESPLFKCNGCDEDIARDMGADIEVTSVVQKTSNLILSFSATIKDVPSGRILRAGSVDIRGNTDEMWLRGIGWLVRNRLLQTPLPDRP